MSIIRPCRVLFVDDEPLVLDGIRLALRTDRATIDMVFVTSAAEALRWVADQPCDVVVSDMRMPIMDGAELFGELSFNYPKILRILLSGQTDAASQLRADRAAHRVFAKPVPHAVLAQAIRDLYAQRDGCAHPTTHDSAGGDHA